MAPKTKKEDNKVPKQLQQGEKAKKKKQESLDQQPSKSQDQDQTVSGAAPIQSGSDTVSASIAPQTNATEASGSNQAEVSPPPRTQHEILKDFSDEWIVSLDRDDKNSQQCSFATI